MDTSLIILGVALIIILYIVFFYMTAKDSLADRLDLAQTQTPILATSLTKPESAKYSYEMWLYVYGTKENATSTGGSYIFYRNAVGDATKNIGLKLTSTTPSLTLEYTKTDTSNVKSTVPIQITDNLPLQSWVHIIISVDNKYIDIYMNGKLVKSVKDSIDTPSDSTPVTFEVSKTYLAKFDRTAAPIDPQTAWNSYLSGNGENPIKKYTGDYNLALSFKKGEKDSDAWKYNILGGQ
jgi:hypothetical protein